MDDFRLKAFFAVASNLSFTKASEELFVSQPAITKHIAKLEGEYGVRLFDRLGGKVRLTAAGEILYEKAARILKAYEDLDYAMHLLTAEKVGKLRLGASTTIAQYVLPKLLSHFTLAYPKLEVTLLNGNSRMIEEALKSDLIDLGFVEGLHHTQGLSYAPLLPDELYAAAGADFPYASLTFEMLKSVPLVLRERGSGTLEVIEKELSRARLELSDLNVVMYLGSTEAIKGFLKNSQAIGIISGYALSNELKLGSLKLLSLEGLSFKRQFMTARLPGELKPQAEVFLSFLEEELEKDLL